jgi:hypothetical protein
MHRNSRLTPRGRLLLCHRIGGTGAQVEPCTGSIPLRGPGRPEGKWGW